MDDPTALGARALSDALAQGRLTAVTVMEAFVDRIERVNPALNAIVSLRPRADLLAEARQADAASRRGWLHGIPIAIKDLADTAGLRTTYGSPLFADHVPEADALMVQRLRAAGAIVIGKTNTPEFGLGSHTFNPVFGATRNPYAPDRTAGGSSGGAAAALSARLLPVADGSDMMGSLRNPAAFCNVYGFRPTWGLVPGEPLGDGYLHQLSTAGPMARDPGDLAALLATMAGPDPRLPHGRAAPADLTDLSGPVAGTRIAWLGDWGGAFPCEPGILARCEAALAAFQALGCTVTPLAPPFEAEALWEAWLTLRAWGNAARMRDIYDDPAKRAQLKSAMIWEIEQGLHLSAQAVHQASEVRSAWLRAMVALGDRFDAFALPSAQVWPFALDRVHPEAINGQPMDTYHRWMQVVVPVSLIGLPALGLPAGFGEGGLPMGMQLFGQRGADRALLTLGRAYHDATDWPGQRPPEAFRGQS